MTNEFEFLLLACAVLKKM